ncbi:MAG: pentapeptide repeat-containing protein [Deltaproteobacteria bacterium]|nr:pentapeptide repeat-containing protein [Deltaproteobacteria bacterium]
MHVKGWFRALAVAALLCGCGSDNGDSAPPVVGPLPRGPDAPQAYSEDFLARNPRALAHLEQLMIVQLESTAEGDDSGDTCNEREGIDCVSYAVEAPTVLTLSIDASAPEVARLTLRDAAGAVVLTAEPGAEPVTTALTPGDYAMEIVHAFAGDPSAETPTIFLQPQAGEAAGESDAEPAADAAARAPGEAAPAPPRSMALTAGRDCLRCSFARSDLTDQHFDGANLTGSNFREAKFLRTTLRGATLTGCTMTDLYPRSGDVYAEGGNLTDRFDADFSDAKAAGVHFSFAIELAFRSYFPLPFFAIFRGATLDDTLWHQDSDPSAPPSNLRPDFSNASLQRAHFSFIVLTTPTKCAAASRARKDACSFRGADLSGAVFDDYFWNMNNLVEPAYRTVGNNLAHCSFGIEPTSGRATTMRQVDMRPTDSLRADMSNADLSGADLTGATLDLVELDDEAPEACQRVGATLAGADLSGASLRDAVLTGANLAKAKLPGATVTGVKWRGVNLSDAVLTGMVPATFNDLDLAGANFSGVDFSGFDLTRTDFSRAQLSVPPNFGTAALSDGVRGVNISGHKFPPRYQLFKGRDLSGVAFNDVELLEANLEGTIFNNAKLVGANLNFVNLRGAKLRGATLGVQPGTEAQSATLRGAFMPDVDLSDADLRTVDLTAAHLYGDLQHTLLVRTRLDSANFVNAVCSGVHFSGSMNNAVFVGAQLVNSVFNGATLTGTKFDDAYLQGADFSGALSATGAVLSNAAVSAAAGNWSYSEQDGTPFTFRYQATKLGPLGREKTVRCPNGALGPCCPDGNIQACLSDKLKPVRNGPFPPIPECVAKPPRYDNCVTPRPTATPRGTPTPTRS